MAERNKLLNVHYTGQLWVNICIKLEWLKNGNRAINEISLLLIAPLYQYGPGSSPLIRHELLLFQYFNQLRSYILGVSFQEVTLLLY
jgi:hypothetical protein